MPHLETIPSNVDTELSSNSENIADHENTSPQAWLESLENRSDTLFSELPVELAEALHRNLPEVSEWLMRNNITTARLVGGIESELSRIASLSEEEEKEKNPGNVLTRLRRALGEFAVYGTPFHIGENINATRKTFKGAAIAGVSWPPRNYDELRQPAYDFTNLVEVKKAMGEGKDMYLPPTVDVASPYFAEILQRKGIDDSDGSKTRKIIQLIHGTALNTHLTQEEIPPSGFYVGRSNEVSRNDVKQLERMGTDVGVQSYIEHMFQRKPWNGVPNINAATGEVVGGLLTADNPEVHE